METVAFVITHWNITTLDSFANKAKFEADFFVKNYSLIKFIKINVCRDIFYEYLC